MKNYNHIDRLIEQYDYHNMLFENVLENISHQDALVRINGNTNHILWLAGNFVSTRYDLAKKLGATIENPNAAVYENHKAIQNDLTYPAINEILDGAESIRPILKTILADLPDSDLLTEPSFKTPPILDNTLLSYILFLIDRESYVIGQIAFIRKALGYEAMKYN